MKSVPPEGTLSHILMGTIKIDLEVCAVAEFAQSLERIPTDANASGIFSGQASTRPICMRTSAQRASSTRPSWGANHAHVYKPTRPKTALAWLPFLILCAQTRSKRLIKMPRRHSRFTRTQACLRSVGARKHNCPQNTLSHRRRHLTHAASKARNVSSAWNASAYST